MEQIYTDQTPNSDIQKLLSVSLTDRSPEWENQFLAAFPNARLRLLDEAPKSGPDGWPYLFAEIDQKGQEPALEVIRWLTERGIGLAVNPQKDMPDFVFSSGMLWNFRETGAFISDAPKIESGDINLENGQKVWVGTPTEQYLPSYVRTVLRKFFADQAVEDVKICLLSFDEKNFDLCFSVQSLDNPPPEEHQGIAEAISWFLPLHYSISLIDENIVQGFVSL